MYLGLKQGQVAVKARGRKKNTTRDASDAAGSYAIFQLLSR
jgi:hypothetical protein